jgi:hypothetical protein
MKAKNAEEIIKGIDFPLLKEQKKALLKLIEDIDNVPVLEKLEGIVLINEIQDSAVDFYGMEEKEVFDLHDDEDEPTTDGEPVKSKPYFEITSSGYNKELEREEIQIHAGENGNVFLFKTPEGFVIDIYNQMENIDSLTVWEDDLSPLEITIDPVLHADRIAEFLVTKGQKHSEITANLGLRPSHADSDEILMEDFFYLEGHKKWYPKSGNSMYGDFENAIADYLRNNRDNY